MQDSAEIPVIIHSLLRANIGVCQIRNTGCKDRKLPAEIGEKNAVIMLRGRRNTAMGFTGCI